MSLDAQMPTARTPKPKRAAPKGAASGLGDALGEAGWAEADRALARALAEFELVESARTAVSRADALALLRQALARAARTRGFSRVGGEPGAIEAYDPKRHELVRTLARPPQDVAIISQGVARGGEVLVRARVKALRRRPT